MSLDNMEDAYNLPIDASDAAAMLRRRPQNNDRPYIANTTKLNNQRIDEWKKTVLDKIADGSGRVPSGRVWDSWQLFNEGKEVTKYYQLYSRGLVPEIPPNILEFWKNFFEEKTVEEMHSYGSGTVSVGWGIIQSYLKMWFADQKYNKLFGKYSDPLDWEKNRYAHTPLLTGEILPFWNKETLDDISQKVSAVLLNQVVPGQPSREFR